MVLACLPAGEIGTNSTAAVAIADESSFRSIRVGLIIGTGIGFSGAEADVRRGDVVVSQPEKGELTRSLNILPWLLLSAVAKP